MTPRLPSLIRSKRTLLGCAAIACYAAAIVFTPTDVRSQLATLQPEVSTTAAPHAVSPLAVVVPQGDAFAPRAEMEDDRPPSGILPAPIPLPRLPGNQITQRAAPSARVTAIATGTMPSAIVEDGGAARVVSVGDTFAGSTIAEIERAGIVLANGRRFSLEPAATAP